MRKALGDLIEAAAKDLKRTSDGRHRLPAASREDPGPSAETLAKLQEVQGVIEEQERLITGFQKENERLVTELRQCVSQPGNGRVCLASSPHTAVWVRA